MTNIKEADNGFILLYELFYLHRHYNIVYYIYYIKSIRTLCHISTQVISLY